MTASSPSISFWRLGWRTLWRDVRAGELRMLVLAVLLAVAALTAVGFFADRLNNALLRDAAQMLGGDVVVSSDQPTPAAFVERARTLGLTAIQTQTFPTMARTAPEKGEAGRLVMLKAVSAGYPLRGTLGVMQPASAASAGSKTREGPTGTEGPAGTAATVPASSAKPDPVAGPRGVSPSLQEQAVTHGPGHGEIWPEPAVLDTLGLQIGDDLLLGESRLRISGVLTREPDRGNNFVNFAPRAMMALEDLPATQLVQPASRVNYRLALVGPANAVRSYTAWAQAELKRPDVHGIRVEALEGNNPQMQQTLGRAGNFLNLVALLAALLSVVAVALAARGFAARHLDDCAMLRVLGLPQRKIALAYTFEFALLGLLGSALGLLLGYLVHYAFVWLLAGLVKTDLPPPGAAPFGLGLGVGMTLLLAFGLPPVLQLAGTPPLRVIRRELGQLKAAPASAVLLGVAGFAALLLATSQDLKLGLIAVGGFAGAVLLFMLLGWLAVLLLRGWLRRGPRLPHWLSLAWRQLTARPVFAMVQVSSLAVGLLALLLLLLLRTDLVEDWKRATPVDAPDRFVINIMPDQAEAFRAELQQAGVRQYDWYPMVRGRLVAINGRAIAPEQFQEDRARRLVDREFNLSFSAQRPAHNPVVAGSWRDGDAQGLSMEQGIMETLGLKLGDRLLFDMGGVQRENTITSVRKVDWTSMHVNFFAMYPVASLGDEVATTWITAYRTPPPLAGQPSLDNRLLQTFPNITQIDMTATIRQVQGVLEQVIRAVELLFGFGLAAGVVVLFATVSATREERARELAIMRALGAGNRLLGRMLTAELAGTGALAGLLAALVALALGWALARYVFEFDWSLAWWVLPAGTLAGSLLSWLAGRWSLHGLLRRPVVATLRAATTE